MCDSADTSKDYSFVRCRSQYGIPAYGMTTVRYLQTGDAYVGCEACVEMCRDGLLTAASALALCSVHLKRILSAREYSYAVRHRNDPTREVIKQQRMCFLYNNQSFQVHVYKEPSSVAGQAVLHVQASGDNSESISLPSFLTVEREILDESVSAYNVSLKESADGSSVAAAVGGASPAAAST